MHDLPTEIERAIKAGGWSARQASIEAVGNPDMARGMRREDPRRRTGCGRLATSWILTSTWGAGASPIPWTNVAWSWLSRPPSAGSRRAGRR